MKKLVAVLMMLAAAFLPNSSALFAQGESPQPIKDQDIELLRKDIRSQRKQLVAANMMLTDAEAQKFWPVYDQYTAELTKIGDERLAQIKQYAQVYDNMTEAQAQDLLKRSLGTDRQVVELRQKYVPLFQRVLSAKKTATFFQIDRRLGLMLDLQLASAIPLVE